MLCVPSRCLAWWETRALRDQTTPSQVPQPFQLGVGVEPPVPSLAVSRPVVAPVLTVPLPRGPSPS